MEVYLSNKIEDYRRKKMPVGPTELKLKRAIEMRIQLEALETDAQALDTFKTSVALIKKISQKTDFLILEGALADLEEEMESAAVLSHHLQEPLVGFAIDSDFLEPFEDEERVSYDGGKSLSERDLSIADSVMSTANENRIEVERPGTNNGTGEPGVYLPVVPTGNPVLTKNGEDSAEYRERVVGFCA